MRLIIKFPAATLGAVARPSGCHSERSLVPLRGQTCRRQKHKQLNRFIARWQCCVFEDAVPVDPHKCGADWGHERQPSWTESEAQDQTEGVASRSVEILKLVALVSWSAQIGSMPFEHHAPGTSCAIHNI